MKIWGDGQVEAGGDIGEMNRSNGRAIISSSESSLVMFALSDWTAWVIAGEVLLRCVL